VIEREAPLDVSNVMLVCPSCGQPTRVGYRLIENGGKVRTCRRANCGKDIDKA
jgi:large subunit ribosomal protein L24